MNHYDILVIGGGPGGMGAALRAAELGRKTALVERAELGGVCLNWGCIPTKALLKSAQVYHYCRTADAFGVTLGGEAKPDMARIVARSRGVSETMRKGVGFLLEKNKVDVLRGEARLAGEGRVIVADETVSADHIILATGRGRAKCPSCRSTTSMSSRRATRWCSTNCPNRWSSSDRVPSAASSHRSTLRSACG